MGKKDHKKKGGKNESVGQAGNKSQKESVSQTGNKSILQVDLSSESDTPPSAGAGAAAAASTPVTPPVVSSCGLCRFPDTEDMVECDKCEQWYHYKCVGVGDSVADRDFSCKKCKIAAILKPTLQVDTEQKSQPDRTEDSSKLVNEVEQLRRRLDNQLKAFEEITAKKDEDIERTLTRQRELFDTQLQAVQQQHQQKLQVIQQQQKQQLQAVKQQQKQQSQAVQQQQKQWLDSKATDFVPQTHHSDFGGGKTVTGTLPKASSTVVGGFKSTSGKTASYLEQQRKLLDEKQALEKRHLEERLALEQRSEQREEEPVPTAAVNDSSIRGWSEADLLEFLAQNSTNELSRSQLAARQAVARELPPFEGNSEEWPLFIASFESSTRICGYSDEENLLRLQRSLKGKALETVRCRLLHPSNLAGVIVTLRTLFGRPEIIIHSLVTKIKEMPSPKIEKLDSLIEFGVAVQNMCATIKACGLDDYMCNVALLQELVERLPPTIKLNWAIHRQTLNRVNMMDFGDWLGKLVEAACSVTIPSIGSTVKVEKRGRKDDNFLNVHSESSPNLPQPREASDNSAPSQLPKQCGICRGGCNAVDVCERFQEMDVDSRWSAVREHKLCRKCLQKHFGACQIKDPCGKNGCPYMHNQLLHDESRFKKPEAAVADRPIGEVASQNCNTHLATSANVLFRYVPVTIHGKGVTVSTYAFLDDGSSATFIEHGLLKELNLEGDSHPLCLNWTGGQQREENESVKLSLKISGIHDQNKRYVIPKVHTVRNLSLPLQSVSMAELAVQYKHLEGLPVDSFASVTPRILIGVDNAHLGYPVQCHEGGEDQPIAVKTKLGWIVYGPCEMTGSTEIKDYTAYHSFHISTCQRMVNSKQNTTSSKSSLPEDDERALEQLSSKTQIGDRFETGLVVRRDLEDYDVSAMTFGATCTSSSARFVKNLNAARFQEHFPIAVVDDMLTSIDSEEEVAKLEQVEQVQVSRCYRSATTQDNNAIQLHAVVDTSENGVIAVAYRKSEQSENVAAKNGKEPWMSVSTPRLELQDAAVGARLASRLKRLETAVASSCSWVSTKQNMTDKETKWHKMPKISPSTRRFRREVFPWHTKEEWQWNSAGMGKTTEELRHAENGIYRHTQRQPNGEEIRNLLVEIEFISSRPLTHVPIDSRTDYPLTGSKPPIAFNDNPVQQKKSEVMADGFRWESIQPVKPIEIGAPQQATPQLRAQGYIKGWSDATCYRPDSSQDPGATSYQGGRARRRFEFEYVGPVKGSGILRTGGECHECRDEPPNWQHCRSDATPRRRRKQPAAVNGTVSDDGAVSV